MAHQNVIDIGFDVDAITAEKKQILDLFVDLFGQLKQYDGTKFNPLSGGGLADLKKSFTDTTSAMDGVIAKANEINKVYADQATKQQAAKKSTDETTLAVQQYGKILDQAAQVQAKSNAASSTAAENLAIDKEQLKQRNAELQKSAAFLTAESNSVGEARAANALLTIERDKQNAKTEEGRARIDQLNAEIDKNNEFIRVNSSLLEKQKINIGNYNGAVGVLESGLNGISEKLNQFAAAGDLTSEAVQKLVLEQQVLKVLLEKQNVGFASATQEIRATKNALDTLTVAGLDNSETFEKLNTIYTQSKQKVEELHNEQKILTSETPGLTALTAAARGLGGAYALGAGASALFADGNEKVEKELNKLVAIMTFLQGLEEAVKAVKDRGAIATALQASATKALNVVRQIEVAIFGEATAAVEADTIAKTINTESTEANVGAVDAETAGKVVNTEVTEAMTVASEGATAATIGFRTALISTGIGAIIIALVYGVTKLVGAISDWINADEKAIEKQKALAEISKTVFDLNKNLNDAYEEGAKKRLDSLEKQDAKVKAAGKNQFIQLGNEQVIAIQRKQIADDELARLGVTDAKMKEFEDKRISNLHALKDLQKDLADATNSGDKSKIKEVNEQIDANKAIFAIFEDKYDTVKKLHQDSVDNGAIIDEKAIAITKAANEELAKIVADGAQRRYDSIKAANDLILSLDSSTEPQRLAAIKSNYNAEVALSGAQIEAIKKLEADKIITEQDAANQIANIQNSLNLKYKASLEEQRKIREDYADRNATAQNAISKNNNESDAAVQEAISKDVQQELDDRLAALKKNIADKTSIIVDDYNLQVKLAKEHGKTQEEIDELASNRDKALVELTAGTQKEIYDITISYGEKRLKAIEDLNKTESNENNAVEAINKQQDALNTSLINGTISYRKYLDQQKKLDEQAAKDKAAAALQDDKEAIARLVKYEKDVIEIKLKAAEDDLKVAQAGGDKKEIANAKAKVDALKQIQTNALADIAALFKKQNKDQADLDAAGSDPIKKAHALLKANEEKLAVDSYNFGKTLVDAAYEDKINSIQKTIDAVNEQADAEIAAVQRSTLSQRDQAAEVIIIQAQQKAKDTELKQQQKQEKIKEAQFDRDLALAEIVWGTAQAVIKDTKNIPWPLSFAIGAVDIALGAVQAATVLARPIPTYGEGVGIPGKGEHTGGYAWTGEKYKPELISIPGQDPFIVDRPTLIDLPAMSSVLPLSDRDMIMDLGGSAMRRGTQWINSWPDNNSWEIVDALNKHAGRLERAIKKSQRKILNTIHVHVEDDSEWIRKKIIGKG